MELFDILTGIINPAWIQVGELGLAFMVVILSAGLALFVIQTSARREKEYLNIITKVIPAMEGMAVSLTNINTRLESIEDRQAGRVVGKVAKKATRKVATQKVAHA